MIRSIKTNPLNPEANQKRFQIDAILSQVDAPAPGRAPPPGPLQRAPQPRAARKSGRSPRPWRRQAAFFPMATAFSRFDAQTPGRFAATLPPCTAHDNRVLPEYRAAHRDPGAVRPHFFRFTPHFLTLNPRFGPCCAARTPAAHITAVHRNKMASAAQVGLNAIKAHIPAASATAAGTLAI